MCSTFGCWSVSINCFARSAGTSEICRPRSTTRCSPSTSTPSSWLLSRAKRSRPRERRRSSFCAVSFAGFKSRRGGGCSRNQLVNSGLLAYYSKGRGGKVDGLARTARGPAVPTYDTEERQQLMEILGSLTGLQEGQLGWRGKRGRHTECELYGAGEAAWFKASVRAAWWSFHWSGSQASSSLNFVCGKFINSCVRYSCGSIWCRRQVLVKLARIANVRPPRGLPTKREFFRFNTTRFISRSLAQCRLLDYAASGNRREGLRRTSGDHGGSGRHNQRLSKKASTGS